MGIGGAPKARFNRFRALPPARNSLFHLSACGGRLASRRTFDGPRKVPKEQTGSRGAAVLRKGSERDLSEVKLKKGEPIDRALRRLKKKVDRENTLKDVRTKRHYEKPSERRRRKLKVARFSAMLSARYADL